MHWINFLHIYQPPTQDNSVLKKIIKESYSHILDLLDQYPRFKISLNISGSLLEKFEENKCFDLIDRFKNAAERGQIEIVGSAMYHPILPLIPESEIRHQIKLSLEKGRQIFGSDYNPKGFYLPEMAYSKKAALIVKEFGFEWLILDEIHFPVKNYSVGDTEGKLDNSTLYEIGANGLKTIFRSRKYSKGFPPELIIKNLDKFNEQYLITAHDGEMYGHWHQDIQGFYQKAFENEKIVMITASEYLSKLSKLRKIEPREASWESTESELSKNLPYAIWNDPENDIHVRLWDLVSWIYPILMVSQNDVNYSWAKKHFDRGISSCYWWWASGRKIDVFSPVSWNPTEIEKGLDELIKSIRSLKKMDKKKKQEAEKMYHDILELVWKIHWDRDN